VVPTRANTAALLISKYSLGADAKVLWLQLLFKASAKCVQRYFAKSLKS
jgi:hypothetical protein